MTNDAQERSRITDELGSSMVVVAGAGTGKTSQLVDRIVMLVRAGARIRDIAAITFTEAAAAELRERIRRAIEDASSSSPEDQTLRSALEEVDDAAISTLHAFARRILVEQCAGAGLPSGFEVMDSSADVVTFNERWARFADGLFDDTDAEPALVKGFTTGLRHTDLKAVAWALHQNWDRVEDLDVPIPRGADARWPVADPTPIVEQLEKALAISGFCSEPADLLLAHLRLVATDAVSQLRAAQGDDEAVLNLLWGLPNLRSRFGQQDNWARRIDEVRAACAAAQDARTEILESVRRTVLEQLVPRLIGFVRQSAEERRLEGRVTYHDLLVLARRLLRRGGDPVRALRLRYRFILVDEFQDTDPIQVEVAARLASDAEDSADLSCARPGGLFVVGDPKQSIYRFRRADIELFDRVGKEIGERIVLQSNFRSVPGILDLVNVVFDELFGDEPEAGQAKHHPLLGERRHLGASVLPDSAPDRNTSEPNGVSQSGAEQLSFDKFEAGGASFESGTREPYHSQSEEPVPPAAGAISNEASVDADFGRSQVPVVVLGDRMQGSASDTRRQAAQDMARCILCLLDDGLQVEHKNGAPRDMRFSDVAVLITTRTALASIEEAFDDLGVPYRLEGASMLWESEDVREVLAVLRAVDDPTDQLSVIGALRSPGLACGDDDLVSWHAGGGRWDPRAPVPDGMADHPVARAMEVITSLHSERWWHEPSVLVRRAIERLRSFELAFAHPRPRDHWQRLRWVCDQALLFDESSIGSLRAFLQWAHLQAEGDPGGRGVGAPDPDDDAVRVMTIHGAKGLEFPVVVLAGLERQDSDGHQPQAVLWNEDEKLEVRAGPAFHTDGYVAADERDEKLDNLERRRLLYVGMTRARDHLVLCLHHRARNGGGDSSLASNLFDILQNHHDLWRSLAPQPDDVQATTPAVSIRRNRTRAPRHETVETLGDATEWASYRESWAKDRAALLNASRRMPVTSATALAAASEDTPSKSGTDTQSDPGWPDIGDSHLRASETGLDIGRAVHAALAAVDLATGRDPTGRSIDELSCALAETNGVGSHAKSVSSMVDAALGSRLLRAASTKRYWRELFVAAPLDVGGRGAPPAIDGELSSAGDQGPGAPRIVEGFVDLLYEDDDGLVVVDYKTDRIISRSEMEGAVERYTPQVAAYAQALEQACGSKVARCVLLFLGSGTPIEHVVEGEELERAKSRAAATLYAMSV